MSHGPASTPRPLLPELPLYYSLVGAYFFAFGMQFVLFPSLVAFVLHEGPTRVGLAQSALSAPMFCFLLFGGLFAERARPASAMATLHLFFAAVSITLSLVVSANALTYEVLILYAVLVGSCAAFLMPTRDAALNGVVAREIERGRNTSLATAAAATTAVQIGAQICGILFARQAGASPGPFLMAQAIALLIAAALSLTIRAPKPSGHERSVSGALRDLGDGLAYAFKNPIMAPMLISAAYVGVFVIGSFQVLFPLIIREAYGGSPVEQAGRLGALFASFWSASFVSAVLLSRLKPLERPGRALIASHLIGAAGLVSLAFITPFWLFTGVVLVWGLAAGVTISMSRTITQGAAHPQYLGRVLAVYSMGFMGGAPIGSALTGFAASQIGPHAAALIPGIGLAIAALVLAVTTPLWRFAPDAAVTPERLG